MLTKRGVWRIDSGVDAICRYSDPKNTALFEAMGVLKPNECAARQEILLDHYVGTVDIEAKCMVDMINKHVLPSAKAAELPQVAALEAALDTLGKAIDEIHASSGKPQADLARTLRLETMIDIREVCDAAEGSCRRDNQITRRLRDNQITRRLPTVCARSNRLFTQACARPTSGRSRRTRTYCSWTRPRTWTRTTSLRALARSRTQRSQIPSPTTPPV